MIKPLHKNVILQKEELQKETQSGIILTTQSKDAPSIARVVAVGSECEANIKEKDRVVYKEYSGTKITIAEVDYIVIEEKDILALLD